MARVDVQSPYRCTCSDRCAGHFALQRPHGRRGIPGHPAEPQNAIPPVPQANARHCSKTAPQRILQEAARNGSRNTTSKHWIGQRNRQTATSLKTCGHVSPKGSQEKHFHQKTSCSTQSRKHSLKCRMKKLPVCTSQCHAAWMR